MRNSIWNKRIPTIAGLLFLIGGVILTTVLLSHDVPFLSKASPSDVPQSVLITNITDTSFSINYVTAASVPGSIQSGRTPQQLTTTTLDDRDQASGTPHLYRTHHITLKNLTPNTQYYLTILSGTTSYGNTTTPYTVTTAATPSTNIITLSGTVQLAGGTPATDTIITAQLGKAAVSAYVQSNGAFQLPVGMLESASTDASSPITVTATNGEQYSTSTIPIPTSSGTLPLITLSQNYTFTTSSVPETASTSASTTPSVSFSSQLTTTTSTTPTIQILSPQSNQRFSDVQPEFSGTALPNHTISLTIQGNIQPITDTIQSDNTGAWTYRPSNPLASGSHTLTISTTDSSGILKTMSQSFTILALGSQFVDPSVSPVITLTSTPTPTTRPTTTIPTTQPTGQPTQQPTTSATVTSSPVTTPPGSIASEIPSNSPGSSISGTGGGTISPTNGPLPCIQPACGSPAALVGLLAGITSIVGGILIFVFTKGAV